MLDDNTQKSAAEKVAWPRGEKPPPSPSFEIESEQRFASWVRAFYIVSTQRRLSKYTLFSELSSVGPRVKMRSDKSASTGVHYFCLCTSCLLDEKNEASPGTKFIHVLSRNA